MINEMNDNKVKKSKKPIIFVSSIIGVLAVVVIILVVALVNNNLTVNRSEITQSTQSESKDLSTDDKLLMAKDYFAKYISLDNYDPFIIDREQSAIFINIKDGVNYESKLSQTIYVEDNIPVTFIETKTSDLLNYGFTKGDKKKEHIDNPDYPYADDVCLLYNDKRLYIDENEGGAIEFGVDSIRAVHFPVNESVSFDYCGIKNTSSFQDVVECLGEPSGSSDIHYVPKNDNCTIALNYCCDFEFNGTVFAYFIFDYNYMTNTTELRDIYMFD